MMKTINGIEITYEHSFNALESIKKSFHEGEEILTIIDYCQDLLADSRLSTYPDIQISANTILFNYENYEDISDVSHLVIKINTYGFNDDDKILSYFYINGEHTQSNATASWEEALDVIRSWNTK